MWMGGLSPASEGYVILGKSLPLFRTISFLRVRSKWADTQGAYSSVRQDHHEGSSWGEGVTGGGYSSRQKEKGWQKSLKVLCLHLHH